MVQHPGLQPLLAANAAGQVGSALPILSYIKERKSVMRDNGEAIRTWLNVGIMNRTEQNGFIRKKSTWVHGFSFFHVNDIHGR